MWLEHLVLDDLEIGFQDESLQNALDENSSLLYWQIDDDPNLDFSDNEEEPPDIIDTTESESGDDLELSEDNVKDFSQNIPESEPDEESLMISAENENTLSDDEDTISSLSEELTVMEESIDEISSVSIREPNSENQEVDNICESTESENNSEEYVYKRDISQEDSSETSDLSINQDDVLDIEEELLPDDIKDIVKNEEVVPDTIKKVFYEFNIDLEFGHLLTIAGRIFNPLNSTEFDYDEVSSDARSTLERTAVPLDIVFMEIRIALKRFFRNDAAGATAILARRPSSVLHNLCAGILDFIPAIYTFERNRRIKAKQSLCYCIYICDFYRRDDGVSSTMANQQSDFNYGIYSDLESFSEVAHACAQCLLAIINLIEAENIGDYTIAATRLVDCYICLIICCKLIQHKLWNTEECANYFKFGVSFVINTFNFLIKALPPKVIELLQTERLLHPHNEIFKPYEALLNVLDDELLPLLRDVGTLIYNLIVNVYLRKDVDIDGNRTIIQRVLNEYPRSIFLRQLKGRWEMLSGRLGKALENYGYCDAINHKWSMFKHISHWESMWISSMTMDWDRAVVHIRELQEISKWARTIFTYHAAATLLENDKEWGPEYDRDMIKRYMSNIPLITSCGVPLQMESFILIKSRRFKKQGNQLLLPGVELMALGDMFDVVAKDPSKAAQILDYIQRTKFLYYKGTCGIHMGGEFDVDNRCLMNYLHGCALRATGVHREAINKFYRVVNVRAYIKDDHYLVPYSLVGAGLCYLAMKEYDYAITVLNMARNFSGYCFEARLRLKISKTILEATRLQNATE